MELPLKKKDEPIALWKIISKFIGQDFTKVSMPVILNEPTSALQRNAEGRKMAVLIQGNAEKAQSFWDRIVFVELV